VRDSTAPKNSLLTAHYVHLSTRFKSNDEDSTISTDRQRSITQPFKRVGRFAILKKNLILKIKKIEVQGRVHPVRMLPVRIDSAVSRNRRSMNLMIFCYLNLKKFK
jgi:hypothetical protein